MVYCVTPVEKIGRLVIKGNQIDVAQPSLDKTKLGFVPFSAYLLVLVYSLMPVLRSCIMLKSSDNHSVIAWITLSPFFRYRHSICYSSFIKHYPRGGRCTEVPCYGNCYFMCQLFQFSGMENIQIPDCVTDPI